LSQALQASAITLIIQPQHATAAAVVAGLVPVAPDAVEGAVVAALEVDGVGIDDVGIAAGTRIGVFFGRPRRTGRGHSQAAFRLF
jgi:hypothetical protein